MSPDDARRILDLIADCYLSLDRDGKVMDINPRAEALLQRSRADLLGKVFWDEYPGARRAPGFAAWHAAIEARRPAHAEGKSSQSDRWFEAYAYPDDTGGTHIIFRDITRRKWAEEALVRSHRELERFTYIVSHDLQEPLRMVTSYVTLLKRKYGTELDERAQEFIDFAVDGADRMKRLIQALLDYSRAASAPQDPRPVDLGVIARNVVNSMKFGLGQIGAEVDIGHLPTIQADPSQMTRVMQHLLGNAMRFRSERPLRVTITSEPRGLGEWQITVRDNGIGFEPQYRERIFEIFQRLNRDTDRAATGVGLPICKKIIEEHGGRIWADSSPGQGAAFHFTLPAASTIGPSLA